MSRDNAIAKINAEMQKDPTNTYLEILGHYMIDRCTEDAAAAAALTDSKTLAGAMAAIEKEARKKAKGNRALLKDRDILDIIDTYFALPHNEAAREACVYSVDGDEQLAAPGTRPALSSAATPRASGVLSMSLEDFI